jgi:hypothetical protein
MTAAAIADRRAAAAAAAEARIQALKGKKGTLYK